MKAALKENQLVKAALLAKTCSECLAFQGKGPFKQMYLVCLCSTSEQDQLMNELSKEDCRDALEMICNLESDGDERAAFSLCSAFLTRQLLQGDTYCAWELTLFWSKLLKRFEPSEQAFLSSCRQMSLLSKTVYHILFFIKVIQSEIDSAGLPVCVEMCIRALRMESGDGSTKATVCKTISCLLPTDLEVKRACQLTEFLLEPTVDSYYAVETLYNEPDQKLEEENMPVPNSLRCELLLVFKTQWPFDPEFWDWKTLKRNCLSLMGEEASIVSSIDLLNDTEAPEEEDFFSQEGFKNIPDPLFSGTYELKDITDKRQKNREMKKLREKGFISARLGKFACGHQGCTESFTAFWKYVGHIKEQHKDMKLAKADQLNGSFKCEIEGCDRSYATKSNLLRHVMKKHQDLYQPKFKNQQIKEDGMKQNSKTLHYQITKTSNGKENIESNKKILQKGSDTKRVSKAKNNHWTKYGKPSLKSKVEACAMCTKKFPLQYPCMIKGCESVMKSERSILKHYMGHGLSEKYLEQQRSHFIFCKKFPRQKYRSIRSDDSKSDITSDLSDNELTVDTVLEGGEYEYSKPVLRKRATSGIHAALFDSKLSHDESSDGSVVLKRKRGRPRKLIEKIVKRKKIPHVFSDHP
ncbi:hypothetical protein L3Q82_001191 [Scortum barcoo]|uniref:Uncharacterized protein n=1 Tax=Scortum barcoo TaxID=214431 RepID=A0ACB8W7Q1_9TELE|nr:hypothetical protein L3Q82_001191 [Scortum barcoo]